MKLFENHPYDQSTRDETETLATEFLALRDADATRIRRMLRNRKEMESARENDFSAGGSIYDYQVIEETEALERHNIAVPLGQVLTVKHTHRVAGRLPDAIVDRMEENAQERYRSDTMEKMWWSIVRESGEAVLFQDGAWDGSQLGSACLEAYIDFKGGGMPVIRSVDPASIVVVRGMNDPHDFERAYRYWEVPVASAKLTYGSKMFRGAAIPVDQLQSTHKTGDHEMITIVQCADKNRVIRFALGGDEGRDPGKSLSLDEWNHGLGFVPYIVIPNIGPYRDIWGWADYDSVRGLLAYIPQLLGREADIIRAVANGAMIDKGTGEDPEVIKKILREGGVISSRPDGNLDPVGVPDVPVFESEHRESIFRILKMLSFTPDAAWGEGGAGSGSDRSLQLQPQLELTALKQANWSAGLSRLAKYCYQIVEKKGGNSVYRGARPSATGKLAKRFSPVNIGPDQKPLTVPNPGFNPSPSNPDGELEPETIDLPRTPAELFRGDYSIRFNWQNRIDPDDPAYVSNELNKFAQGAQSLRTTLERLGCENPEDEIKLIEEEAQNHPWLRAGMIKQLELEFAQAEVDAVGGGSGIGQGSGGGAPPDMAGGLLGSLQMMQQKDGSALDADATRSALPGAVGEPYGGA